MTTVADKLRALAQAATPGPWHRHSYGHRSVRSAAGSVARSLFRSTNTDLTYVHGEDESKPHIALTGNGPKQTANADYIAAMSPDVALALADLLDAAARMRDADIIVAPADWPISQAFAAAVAHVEEVLDE